MSQESIYSKVFSNKDGAKNEANKVKPLSLKEMRENILACLEVGGDFNKNSDTTYKICNLMIRLVRECLGNTPKEIYDNILRKAQDGRKEEYILQSYVDDKDEGVMISWIKNHGDFMLPLNSLSNETLNFGNCSVNLIKIFRTIESSNAASFPLMSALLDRKVEKLRFTLTIKPDSKCNIL
ncbi:Hypothetical protein ORPV_769 [Orpheovirus IHUMI-LCC2]|uniref:Uncharacterized protein n=1 Tax=Orpheovirus IHUMI-LCC2 TaxID=2023057 RepID=A0A2I2L562_9VIRU|nr:Hypothetical protein ORPV_769 [Orpheovirus IHUMI-LCC2]SNW62673.1 Hypothetical protein ORPV_769 [Orpheovirus IHUMI-LCC2]